MSRSRTAACVVLALVAIVPFVACKNSSSTTAPASSTHPSIASAKPASSKPIDVLPIPAGSVAAAVNPANLPAYNGPTGSIEGTISVTGDPPPDMHLDFSKCPQAAPVYDKLFREGPATTKGDHPLADAIVGVIDIEKTSKFFVPERNEAVKVSIENCAIAQRTIVLTYGQRLEVANKSPGLFAPQFTQVTMPALMLAPTNADAVKLYPPKPGRYLLIDRLGHEYMSADVFALLFSLHDSTNLEGHYRIDGVPIGKRKVFAQHPSFPGDAAKDVDVLEGVVHKVDLTLTYQPTTPDAGVSVPATTAKRPSTILR